jgi:7-keto-8-aminopelargonate synthetase-like enzyme
MAHHHQSSPHTFNGDLGTALMAGGGVVAATEAMKAADSRHHTREHIAHAAIGAATAVGGYELAHKNRRFPKFYDPIDIHLCGCCVGFY